MDRSTQIAELLSKADDAYYGSGQPIMSDAEYDTLTEELRGLDPMHPQLTKLGGARTLKASGWVKTPHQIPMGSLNKAQSTEDFRRWAKDCKHRGGQELVIMDKLDGASLSLRYLEGEFVQAITRGDGVQGEDITSNVKLMKGVVKKFPGFTGHLRGEVICTHDDFEAYFPGQSNPRNTANGTMKRQSDAESCKYLTVVMFQMLPDEGALSKKSQEFARLKKAGFTLPRYEVVKTLAEVESVYDLYVASIRSKLNYDIDGLVIQFDDEQHMDSLGAQGRGPKGAIAFKFPHEEKATTLREIVWQVGKSGRITPVALFDPVVLAGATVKQASLHNISNIHQLASAVGQNVLASGDQVLVCRRNDVIPYLESVISATEETPIQVFPPPDNCPSCQTPTRREGEYLICPGDNCPAQTLGSITRWIDKIGVLHFGEALVEALLASGMVEDIADLYTVDPAEAANLRLASGSRVGGTATKAFKNLHALKELDLEVFVGSLGIPQIGRSMAKTIVDGGFDSLLKMTKAHPRDLASISGMGESKAISFYQGFHQRMPLIGKLLGVGVKVKKITVGPLTGKTLCVTGFRGQREADLKEAVADLGGTFKSGVSRSLDYLICDDPDSSSGKPTKARKYNSEGKAKIAIMGLEDFWAQVIGRPMPD